MGAQWKHAGRIENSSKRGALISKLVKEIQVAAKGGEGNARLRAAVEAAKKASVPRDNIDRAVKKGLGQSDDAVEYELVTYEGFAPHQVPVLVECLTENKNRTASDMRVLFRKGHLGSIGSVAWKFQRHGLVEASHVDMGIDHEAIAIEAGAQSVDVLEDPHKKSVRVVCDITDLDAVSKYFLQAGWNVTLSEIAYTASSPVSLEPAAYTEVVEFLNEVDDHGDVHRVYAAL